MEKEQAFKLLLLSMVILATVTATVTAVVAARTDEVECIPKPVAGLSLSSVSQGVGYIMAGGVGPLLILVIAFIVGMVVSHVVWGGF